MWPIYADSIRMHLYLDILVFIFRIAGKMYESENDTALITKVENKYE